MHSTAFSNLRVWAATLVAAVIVGPSALAADPVYDSPEAAKADPDFAVQGEYAGKDLGVQVIALGDGEFRIVSYRGGLPSAGYNGKDKQTIEGDREEALDIVDGMKRVDRQSPTIGAKPPRGAVVLFDGSEKSLDEHWKPGAKMTDDGLLMQGCTSIDTFQDFSIHVEFRIPFMPKARGQARGNSGLYYQGRYETQMLDSFGLEGKDNETGGIYEIRGPDINACLPPLVWQTYDADFTAARFDPDGKKISNARLTVKLNGILVHQDVEIPRKTRAAPLNESAEAGPIYLQNHGNPVRYRNIWVLPRDMEKEARRPIVPGFERFHGAAATDLAAGGRLLAGELNCTSCHKSSDEFAARLSKKQAPILDAVGARIRPEYMAGFIADPHAVKPGTTMPDLFSGMSDLQRGEAVSALVNFLMTTGKFAEQGSNRKFAQNGEKLFHTIGCVACHLPRNGTKASAATSIPLVALEDKYSIPSLTEFLKNPHQVRPSGRMPSFELDNNSARDLANYLVGEVALRPRNPNMRFAVYEGSWNNVPDYDEVKPVKTGESAGLDLNMAGRTSNFGMRFEGFLKIERDGEYRFHLGSDDGSLLFIDDQRIVDSDGVHPHQVRSATKRLTKGMHPIRVDYAQVGGEWTLDLEYEGPGIPRQSADTAIMMDEAGNPEPEPEVEEGRFVFDISQVEKGRRLFATLGCAACHQLTENGKAIQSLTNAKPLDQLQSSQGCLAEPAGDGTPDFALTSTQQDALAAAIDAPAPSETPSGESLIRKDMEVFNCYACHVRDGIGGPQQDRNPLLLTTIPEMGDEARIPPPLDGVGDKLKESWLKHLLANGAKDRPYMLTRMPKFGSENVGHLSTAFVAVDQRTDAEIPQLSDPIHRVKSRGRFLVGDKALACIKCHTFGKYKATGVQAIDLQTMTKRIREDWFHRYLPNPIEYRPGTRMPSGFPNGRSTVTDVYDGDPDKQIAAIWTYLSDGDKASIPDGLVSGMIELVADKTPVIYRNFITGLSPRGIAVGYPQHCNLAWDANNLCLTLIWHGKFIDASKHWVGRGAGTQAPLGDHVMRIETTVPLAILESPTTAWPSQPPKERGYQFRGYTLNEKDQPTFLYKTDKIAVADFPEPIAMEQEGVFRRRLTITADSPVERLYFLAAAGKVQRLEDGWYSLNDAMRIRLSGGDETLRSSSGRTELIVPIDLRDGQAEIVQEIVW